MADSRFLRVFSALERRRGWVFGGLALAVLLAGLGLTQVRFDNTLDLMLPADSPAQSAAPDASAPAATGSAGEGTVSQ